MKIQSVLGREWRSTRIDILQIDQVCGTMWRRDMEIFFCELQPMTGMGKLVGTFAGDMTPTKGFVKGIG